MFFAFIPLLVLLPWLAGGGLWALIKLIGWIFTDPHRDFVVTMGPIHSGKSELQDAYNGKRYDPQRMESAGWKKPVKIGGWGKKLCIAIPDFGGTENQAKEYCAKIIAEIEKRKPEYILTQFVFDVSKLPSSLDGIHEVADSLQFHLNMLIKSIETNSGHAKKSCENGRWRYEIIGTHRDCIVEIPNTDALHDMEKEVKYMKRVHSRIELLDLKTDDGRKHALQHLIDVLEIMHKG